MIESFAFGVIVVDGLTYRTDILIFPDGRVQDSWRRGSGHRLVRADIDLLIRTAPQVIVAGTGIYGRVQLEEGLQESLAGSGIDLIGAPNEEAVRLYNEKHRGCRSAACFHLTC